MEFEEVSKVFRGKISAKQWDLFLSDLSTLTGFCGAEEIDQSSGSSLQKLPSDLDILEFGTEAAEKASQWIDSQRFRHPFTFFRVYFSKSFSPADFESLKNEYGELDLVEETLGKSQDYLAVYRDSVEGIEVGKNFWVGPIWKEAPEAKKKIFVEPGLAFGTGDHPTTQMCLEALEFLHEQGVEVNSVFDLGCGSGVLSAGLLHLYPKAGLVAYDLDSLCREVFDKCFSDSQIKREQVTALFGPRNRALESEWPKPGTLDLLMSNIYAEVLVQYVEEIESLLKKGGYWLFSGVLGPEGMKKIEKVLPAHFRRVKLSERSGDRWFCGLYQLEG